MVRQPEEPSVNFRKFLQAQIEKTNACRKITAEGECRLSSLKAIAAILGRGENVQQLSGNNYIYTF
jgi:hypothetical protein